MTEFNDPLHRAQERENSDPEERIRPVPLVVAAITVLMVAFGVLYILMSDPFGNSALGDRRTLADLAGPAPGATADGKQLFTAHCVACHQATGKGLAGVFPPLDASEWVTGDTRTLANILLHGINGEIEVAGVAYQGAMPAFQQLSDAELAALGTYIRSSWSNKADALQADLFAQERKANPRTTPWEGGAALKALAAAKPG